MTPPPGKKSPAPTDTSPAVSLARIGAVTGNTDNVSSWIDVQFNPASLQLQVSNELKDTKNNERKQYIAKSNAKLTMELQFDTTDTGTDVTVTTRKIQAFVIPPKPQGEAADQQAPPPLVVFEWGRLKFKGIVEGYKETIDFFSADGVALRSSVNLTLSRQDQVFDRASGPGAGAGPSSDSSALDTPPGSPAEVANQAESPEAARALAAMNGLENLRFGNGEGMTVSKSPTLKPPAGFAGGGGGDLVPGLGDLGVPGADALAAMGAGTAGIADLARLPAADGAFSALRAVTGAATSAARINTSRLLPAVRSSTLSTDRNASFNVGGRATTEGAAGLLADVGAGGLGSRLTFER